MAARRAWLGVDLRNEKYSGLFEGVEKPRAGRGLRQCEEWIGGRGEAEGGLRANIYTWFYMGRPIRSNIALLTELEAHSRKNKHWVHSNSQY